MTENLYIVEKWNDQWGCNEYWMRNVWDGSTLLMKLSVNPDHARKMSQQGAVALCNMLNNQGEAGWGTRLCRKAQPWASTQ